MNNGLDCQVPSLRYWGEEKVEGALYNIYLKKVRYHPSSSINEDDDPDGIAHLEWETVKVRLVKGGTLNKLIECLATEDGELDTSFLNVFMSTFRTFASVDQVLGALLAKFKQLDDDENVTEELREELKKTICVSISIWLDSFSEDFREPPHYKNLSKIIDFAKNQSDCDLEVRARHRLEKFYKEDGLSDSPVINRAISSSHIPLENGDCSCMYDQARPYSSFFDIPNEPFARQLTRIDADLFRKVIPFHCLGSVWSKRDKNIGTKAMSVEATINQFNAVLLRVIATVLAEPDEPRLTTRAKVIEKWVDVAQEVRILKNFSSLKAIISALQSNPLHRLKTTWSYVLKEKLETFQELAAIFSEDNNQNTCRTLLLKEGTAKSAKTVGINDKHLLKVIQKQMSNSSTMQGTVPYLGTFLTDLMYIDTAYPDYLPAKKTILWSNQPLINFDKRRKEFEVLAIIQMLQSATNNYNIDIDYCFLKWFDELAVYKEKETYDISCRIEPSAANHAGNKDKRPQTLLKKSSFGHKKSDSIVSNSSTVSVLSSASLSSDCSSPVVSKDKILSSSSSTSSLSLPSSLNSTPVTSPQSESSPFKTSDFYIIRVALENDVVDSSTSPCNTQDLSAKNTSEASCSTSGVNYKSIMVCNSDHTLTVIKNAMIKHQLDDGNVDDYCLTQILPEGEMVFPQNVNIYYALRNDQDLNFILRPRRQQDENVGIKISKNPRVRRKLLSTIM